MNDAFAAAQRRYRRRRHTQVTALVTGLVAIAVIMVLSINWANSDLPQDHGLLAVIDWSGDPQYFACVAGTIEGDPAAIGATDGFELLPGADPWRTGGTFVIRTRTGLLDARYSEDSFAVTNTLTDPWHFSLTC